MRPTRFSRPALAALGVVLALLAGRPLTQCSPPANEVALQTTQVGRPRIEGDEHFVAQVTSALDLLAERAPDALGVVEGYIGRIRQGLHSGMRAFEDPPTLELADPSTFYSITWCAGSIVHDALHSRLYHEWLAAHGAPVPAAEWTGTAIELACNRVQLAALECIGAPAHELTYLAGQDGTHWDVNGDGAYDERDLRLRDW